MVCFTNRNITGDFINFGYRLGNTASVSYFPSLSENKETSLNGNSSNCVGIISGQHTNVLQTIQMLYPDFIESYHNRVEFVYTDRFDFATGALALQQVVFKNKSDYSAGSFVTVKTQDLVYDYFSTINNGTPAIQPTEPRHFKRLKLTSVTEKGIGSDGTTLALPPYQFTYNETGIYQLPPRLSYQQDHWGFANNN